MKWITLAGIWTLLAPPAYADKLLDPPVLVDNMPAKYRGHWWETEAKEFHKHESVFTHCMKNYNFTIGARTIKHWDDNCRLVEGVIEDGMRGDGTAVRVFTGTYACSHEPHELTLHYYIEDDKLFKTYETPLKHYDNDRSQPNPPISNQLSPK
jgi:hypothetical protein